MPRPGPGQEPPRTETSSHGPKMGAFRADKATEMGYDIPDRDHPHVKRLFDFLNESGDEGYADIHVHPDKPARRLRGALLTMADGWSGTFTQDEIETWLRHATVGHPDPLGVRGHCSVAFDTGRYRARGTFRRSMQGLTTTMRLIPATVPTADQVGVPPQIQALTDRSSGLIIYEGPTGSGKTTALAALINKINMDDRGKHIYMVEDPVEFVHRENGHTSIVQREIGVHALDYPTAIEDALRSRPNVVVIGELLNAATAKAALHAATTGHLVFTTAHAGSVTEALDSYIGQFTADEQPQVRSRLATTLLAVVVQRLVPTVDNRLAAAREVLINNTNFSELIRDEKMHMIRGQIAGSPGCFTMEDSLVQLVHEGKIAQETAYAQSKNPDQITKGLARVGVKV